MMQASKMLATLASRMLVEWSMLASRPTLRSAGTWRTHPARRPDIPAARPQGQPLRAAKAEVLQLAWAASRLAIRAQV
jgi:hypothetical protein